MSEAHDFTRAFSFRIKIGTALTAAHRQRRQCILESLLKRQEFKNRQIHRRMKPDPAFVGTDGRTVLYPITAIDLDFTMKGINESSQKISDIISVIDGIALPASS